METTTNVNFILKRPEEQQGDSGGGSNNNNQNNGNGSNNQTNGGGSNNQTNGGSYNNQNTAGGTTSYGGSSYYYPTTDGSTIYTTDTSNVVVPNTGEHSPTESVGHSNHGLIPIFMILFLVIALAVVVRTIIKQKKSHRNFSGDNPRLGFTPLQISLVGSSTLALAFLGNSLLSSASIENQKSAEAATSLAISSLGTVEAKMEDHFDRKSLGYATEDIVKVTSTSSYGYHVFMQAETSNLYLNGNKESSDYFKPVSGSENGNLHDQDGSWGYHTVQGYADDKCHSAVSGELLDCERVNWLAAPTTATEIANIPAVDSGINSSSTEVYFGGNPSDDLKNGTYSTKITYTVVSDEPAPEPIIPDCSDTVHPTATSGCKMADGNEWIVGNNGESIAWNDIFTGATGEDGHDATLNSSICPAGYSAPKITDYDALVQAYGGEPFATLVHLRDGYKEVTGDVFKLLGLGGDYWSSTENTSEYAFVLSVNNDSSLTTGVGNKTSTNKILCHKTVDNPNPEPEPEPTPPTVENCSATIHPTTTTGCKMADGNEWVIGNNGSTITWNDAFTGANNTDGHDATLNSGICPTGYSAPTKDMLNALISAEGRGQIYTTLGLSTTGVFLSSTEYGENTAYLMRVYSNNADVSNFDKTTARNILCYKPSGEAPTPIIANMQGVDVTTLNAGATTVLKDIRDNQEYTVYRWPTTGTAGSSYPIGLAGTAIMTKDLSIGYVNGGSIVKDVDLALTTADSAGEGVIVARTTDATWNQTNADSNLQYINGPKQGSEEYTSHSYYSYGAAQIACPKGWRPPTPTEIRSIVDFMSSNGAPTIVGAPYNFSYSGTYNQGWYNVGVGGQYWGSAGNIESSAGPRMTLYQNEISNSSYDKSNGCSVRCITGV